jgi:hypothetical protein
MPTRPTISTSSLPSISSLSARTPSLADLPDLPSPVYALVGAGDVALEKALELPGKLATIDTTKLNPREVDVKSIDLPRKLDINVPKFDAAAVTATGLQWAAKAEEVYTSLVARGESVVAKARAEKAAAEDAETPVAQPPASPATAISDTGDSNGAGTGTGAGNPTAKKSPAKKPSAKKATTDSGDAADL